MLAMKDAEKRVLIDRILKASADAKGSRIAASVFINHATAEDAAYFLQYLDSADPPQRKAARQIVGAFGLTEAIPVLQKELAGVIGSLTFLPEAEFREAQFYPNLVDIFETLFAIVRTNRAKNDELLALAEGVFPRTTNEDLRFTLLKLIAFLGDRFASLFALYPSLSDKEKRALYYVYSLIEAPDRGQLYQAGLADEKNFDFVVANMLKFPEGERLLMEALPDMGDSGRQVVLGKLLDQPVEGMEEALIDLIQGEGHKYTIDLATEVLKKSTSPQFPLTRFRSFLNEGASADLVRSAMEILAHFDPSGTPAVLVEAFAKQPHLRNRTLICERLVHLIKGERLLAEKMAGPLLNVLLPVFDHASGEYEEYLVAVCRLLSILVYPHSGALKNARKKVLEFFKGHEASLTPVVKNNIGELIGRFHTMLARLEESEERIQNILRLLEVDAGRIDADRLQKLRDQLRELPVIDPESAEKLRRFFFELHRSGGEDWKKRRIAFELLGDYGLPDDLPAIRRIAAGEASLGVRTAAAEAIKAIAGRFSLPPPRILVLETLPYVQKLLGDFLTARLYDFRLARTIEEAGLERQEEFSHIFVSEAPWGEWNRPRWLVYARTHHATRLIRLVPPALEGDEPPGSPILTLAKPFKAEDLEHFLQP